MNGWDLLTQLIAGIVTGVFAGLAFTVAWGVLSWRREALVRRLDQFGAWMDEASASGGLWFKHVAMYLNNRAEIEAFPDGQAAALADLRQWRIAFHAATFRIAALHGVHSLFDDESFRKSVEAFMAEAQAIDDALAAVDLSHAERDSIEPLKERLKAWMIEGRGLVAYLEKETRLGAICRRYISQHKLATGILVVTTTALIALAVWACVS